MTTAQKNTGYESLRSGDLVKYVQQSTGNTLVKLSAGDVYVTSECELITTVLGSCVAICLRHPRTGLGGMSHFMLPSSELVVGFYGSQSTHCGGRYGDISSCALIEGVLRAGGNAGELEAKVFGGASVVALSNDIGQANANYAFSFLRKHGVAIVSHDVGLDYPRKIVYDPSSGKVQMQRLRSAFVGLVAERERRNLDALISNTRDKGSQ